MAKEITTEEGILVDCIKSEIGMISEKIKAINLEDKSKRELHSLLDEVRFFRKELTTKYTKKDAE